MNLKKKRRSKFQILKVRSKLLQSVFSRSINVFVLTVNFNLKIPGKNVGKKSIQIRTTSIFDFFFLPTKGKKRGGVGRKEGFPFAQISLLLSLPILPHP